MKSNSKHFRIISCLMACLMVMVVIGDISPVTAFCATSSELQQQKDQIEKQKTEETKKKKAQQAALDAANKKAGEIAGNVEASSVSTPLLFDIPGQLNCVPLQSPYSGLFPGAGTVLVQVPVGKDTPLAQSRKAEITLVAATSINVNAVVFGEPAMGGDYFYFAESLNDDAARYRTAQAAVGKTIRFVRYHHDGVPVRVFIVR